MEASIGFTINPLISKEHTIASCICELLEINLVCIGTENIATRKKNGNGRKLRGPIQPSSSHCIAFTTMLTKCDCLPDVHNRDLFAWKPTKLAQTETSSDGFRWSRRRAWRTFSEVWMGGGEGVGKLVPQHQLQSVASPLDRCRTSSYLPWYWYIHYGG